MKCFKNRLPVFLVTIFIFILFQFVIVQRVHATGNLNDSTFFGVWNGSAWTTVGKLNYAYNGGVLSAVEAKVKANDYAGARAELLLYFKNRATRVAPPVGRNRKVADLTSNLTFTGAAIDSLIREISVTDTLYTTVTADVLGTVRGTLGITNTVGYMIMGKTKESSIAQFYSKNNTDTSHRPKLEVVIGGTTYVLNATKDSYIVGLNPANFGTEPWFYVREIGTPYNNETGRSYIVFDLSSLPQNATPSSATLKLYGRNMSMGTKDLYLFHTGNTDFNENTISWTNTLGFVYSWQGNPGGTDWNSPQYSDPAEWVGVQARFYFATSLAGEFNFDTTDTYYSGNLISLMQDFSADKSAGYMQTLNSAIRLGNWVHSYHYIRKSNAMTASANTDILKFIWQEMDYLSKNFSQNGNFGVVESAGLYAASVYFPEFLPNYQSLAETRLLYMFSTGDVYPDFSFKEATTGYVSAVLSVYLNYVKAYAFYNSLTLNPVLEDKVHKLLHFAAFSSAPDCSDVVYGDGDPMNNRALIELYADTVYNDPYLKYFVTGGAEGTPNPVTSILYPIGKIATMRSSWDTSAFFMHFNNGQPVLHAHKDLLSVVLYAYDKQLLVNCGRGSYAGAHPTTKWLRDSTESKNTVEIDDLPMNQGASIKVFHSWKTNNAFDFAEALHNGYSGFTSARSILFIKSKYWIVSDTEIPTSNTVNHNYDQLWHFLPTANMSVNPTTKAVSTAFSSGANLQIAPADPDSIIATTRSGHYSTGYGSTTNANYIAYEKNSKKGTVTFDAVLYPTTEGDGRNISVTRLPITPSVTPATATALKITIPDLEIGAYTYRPVLMQPLVLTGDTAYYYLSKETSPTTARSFDRYNYGGKMAYVQLDNTGSLKEVSIVQGKTLKQDTTKLVNATLPVQSIDVKWDGTTLAITGAELKASTSTTNGISIYAPSATTVTLNGVSIPYTRVGDNVYAVESQATTSSAYVELPRLTMTASSTSGSEVASKAKDDNITTSWHSASMSVPTGFQYIYTDMGASYDVKQIKLIPRSLSGQTWGFPLDFTLQTSVNGIDWDTIPGQLHTGYPRPLNQDGEFFVLPSPVTARYIGIGGTRFMQTSPGTYFMQMAELYPYKQVNQASKTLATSSSTLSGYPESNVIDNNNGTFWGSAVSANSTGSEWITVDMGGSYSVDSIIVVPTLISGVVTCFPVDFKIQYSMDGVAWTDVPGQSYTNYATPANGKGELFTFGSAVATRYIRVLATKFSPESPGNYYFSIAEMYIY